MISISLVAVYPEMGVLARSLRPYWERQGVELTVYDAIGFAMASALHIRSDAVVCRGITGKGLCGLLPPDVPYIEMKTTGFDIIQALHACLTHPSQPQHPVMLGIEKMMYGAGEVAKILGMALEIHGADTDMDIEQRLDDCLSRGADMIIGGSIVVGMAESRKVPAVLIRAGEASVMQGIEEAVQYVQLRRREREQAEHTRISMDALQEGLLTIDPEGRIRDCNLSAVRLLKGPDCARHVLLGQPLAELLPGLGPGEVLSEREYSGIRKNGKGDMLAVSAYPVAVDGRFTGAVATLQNIARVQDMEGQIRSSMHAKEYAARYTFDQCVHSGTMFRQAIEKAYKYSQTESCVLLYGESGTGKELLAQSMHNAGRRAGGNFVAVNCATLSEALMESTLFGYVDGAFTGAAREGRPGLFETAHQGTLFLDEVSEIPLCLQGKLLRVLQEQEVMRLGSNKVIPVNVRIIAASNRNLAALVEKGLFRGDLLYRLDVLELEIPPLRQRLEDIPLLARHFLEYYCRRAQRSSLALSPDALHLLAQHAWPGNIRELRNVCERLGVLVATTCISAEDVRGALRIQPLLSATNAGATVGALGVPIGAGPDGPAPVGTDSCTLPHLPNPSMKACTHAAIVQALQQAQGNKAQAARMLGISRATLWRKLRAMEGEGSTGCNRARYA